MIINRNEQETYMFPCEIISHGQLGLSKMLSMRKQEDYSKKIPNLI